MVPTVNFGTFGKVYIFKPNFENTKSFFHTLHQLSLLLKRVSKFEFVVTP